MERELLTNFEHYAKRLADYVKQAIKNDVTDILETPYEDFIEEWENRIIEDVTADKLVNEGKYWVLVNDSYWGKQVMLAKYYKHRNSFKSISNVKDHFWQMDQIVKAKRTKPGFTKEESKDE